MSKESDTIVKAYRMGWRDRADGRIYVNPFKNKNKDRYKHRAYKNGYYEWNIKN